MSEPERIARVRFKREPNYLYYVKSDEEGWLCIYKTALKRGGKRKEKLKKEPSTGVGISNSSVTQKKEELL